MKIGFYNPYLDSLSGGERYTLTLASHWSQLNDVTLFWDDPRIIAQAQERLNIDLRRLRTVENVFNTRNIFKKLAVSRKYDLIFFLSDGSIPTTFAKYNILHFQVPFGQIRVFPIKLSRYQATVCNSKFTKKHIDSVIGNRASVIYPPVVPIPRKGQKKNVILSVGRFHPLKKQDILIDAFSKLSGFALILAGGLLPADKPYFDSLKKHARKLNVQFYPNVVHEQLADLYTQARFYWHANGYGETNPQHTEHFGISTVEAMSAGCIPVVLNAGGLPEIVRDNKDGYLWNDMNELIRKTKQGMKNKKISEAAIERAKAFTAEKFCKEFDALLKKITE